MTVRSRIRSLFVRTLVAPRTRRAVRALAEGRRRVARRPHVISAFLQLDDPYSYLLAEYLPELAEHYDIELRVYLSQATGGAFQPAPELLAAYAAADAARLARELGIPFLDKGAAPPVEHRRALLAALAAQSGADGFLEEYRAVLALYWRGDSEAAARRADGAAQGDADRFVAAAQALQQRLGHYNSATLHYAGEWYCGVDRLPYLVERLDGLGAGRGAGPRLAALRQVTHASLPVTPPAAARQLPPLELFHSFRSPYSYLSLRQAFALADTFGLQLELRPVLPMVMRGMQVPRAKLLYIVRDAAREAERLRIPFGRIADPVGSATERCLAVFAYALAEGRARDFVLNVGHATWAQGIDLATDRGMRKVTARTGLFWPEVQAAMASDAWRATAEANRETMMESGSWGVPTLRLGDAVFWGQDRVWLLQRHIEELCDTGDGILV